METTDTPTILDRSELMTAEEVAQFLRLSRATVYRLTEARRVPFIRLNGVLRFARKEVEELLATCRVASRNEYERSKN